MSRRTDNSLGHSPATVTAVADIMNAIETMQDKVDQQEQLYRDMGKELWHSRELLKNARDELGRMLVSRNDLEGSEYRVIHRDQARRNGLAELFGEHAAVREG